MARHFDDASLQYLEYSSPVLTGYPISVSAWFRLDDDTLQQTIFGISDTASFNDFFSLRADATSNYMYWSTKTGATTGSAAYNFNFAVDTWYHALGVEVSNVSRYVYLDGSVSPQNTTNVTPVNLDVTSIGVLRRSVDYAYLDGMVAEVGVWNAVLGQAEADMLKLGISPLAVRPQSLISCWRLIGRLSPEIDIVGGYDMSLVNAPTTAAHPPVLYQVPPMMIQVPALPPSVIGPFPTFL